MPIIGTPKELFEKKVLKGEGCWKWTAAVNDSTGQGVFCLNHKTMNAHRAAYVIYVGEIPEGMRVGHSCGQKLCVNPDHLKLVGRDFRYGD